ncbi:MAG: FtsQ-type POTRA domain-containing protein [Actinomycetia bacterium]|nr:FtsQ-type POTRA domain-containing protein [Actinomycetes bacterium]
MVKSKKVNNLVKARRRKVFARKLWTAVKILSIAVFFVGAVWSINYFYNSNYFKVREINIEGNTHYDDDHIEDFLGDLKGSNIFEADKKKIEDSIADNMVWAKSAEMKKIFPNRINIFIEERKPLLILSYKNNYYLLDSEGMVLEKAGKNLLDKYGDLLIVAGAIEYNLVPGEIIAKKNILSCSDIYKGFDDEIISIIKEAGIEDNISGDIFFRTHDGVKIIFGDSSEIIKKVEIFRLLLKEDTNCTIIDLRSPDNPVVEY